MKKLFGCPLAWALFYVGHWVSLPTYWGTPNGRWQNWYGEHSHWLYNWAMTKSVALQDWAFPEAEYSDWWRWWPWGMNWGNV